MRYGSLFSGYGGLDLAVEAVFGAKAAWHAEIEPAPCKVLEARWPGVPNLGDVAKVDWSTVERPEVLCGGFPCTDLSAAGKRAGLNPLTRSGLWLHFAQAIKALRPELVVIENVRGLLSTVATHPAHQLGLCPGCLGDEPERVVLRALGAVLGDLADLGFDAEWCGLPASTVGAAHPRFRIFILAWPADASGAGPQGDVRSEASAGYDRTTDGGRRSDANYRLAASDPGDGPLGDGPRSARGEGGERTPERSESGAGSPPVADTSSAERGAPESDDLGKAGRAAAESGERAGRTWRDYEPAIARWESVIGRPAPTPTAPGKNGQPKLSPYFVEWLMGLPYGWVTDVDGVTVNEWLKMLGNGVVPQQAEAGIRYLYERVRGEIHG